MLAQTIGSNPKTNVNDQKNVSSQVEQRICMSGFHFKSPQWNVFYFPNDYKGNHSRVESTLH
jgi:hypothetical protein